MDSHRNNSLFDVLSSRWVFRGSGQPPLEGRPKFFSSVWPSKVPKRQLERINWTTNLIALVRCWQTEDTIYLMDNCVCDRVISLRNKYVNFMWLIIIGMMIVLISGDYQGLALPGHGLYFSPIIQSAPPRRRYKFERSHSNRLCNKVRAKI